MTRPDPDLTGADRQLTVIRYEAAMPDRITTQLMTII